VEGGTAPYRVNPPQPGPTSPGRPPGTGSPLPNLGNDPIEDSKPTQILSKREIRELQKKEKKAKELREKLEVRQDPHLLERLVTRVHCRGKSSNVRRQKRRLENFRRGLRYIMISSRRITF